MLLDKRSEFLPMEYPWAYDAWLIAQQSFWTFDKISFSQDVYDWQFKLKPAQKSVSGHILKGFTQTELIVGNEFWSNKVAKKIPKPEIIMTALEYAATEMRHTVAYSQVDINLGLKDYKGFLQEPTVKAKIDSLVNLKGKTKEEFALSLGVFSGCTEGVNLFAEFAVLLNFSRFGLLPGIGAIVNYSIIDESQHSDFGCRIFKEMALEYDLYSQEMKKKIYDAFRASMKLEDDFIKKAFEFGDIEGLTEYELTQFMRVRANNKLNQLGLKSNWKNVDNGAFEAVDSWFSGKTEGEKDVDLFVRRGTATYGKGLISLENMWEGNEKI